ncbi:hypothetical protein [Rhizobium sp. F40D2]|uniref:hypothetical protein n=1 Tax=Rhizobium sp. F40D2 TaxID=3453141 RepID=UPI003F275D8E
MILAVPSWSMPIDSPSISGPFTGAVNDTITFFLLLDQEEYDYVYNVGDNKQWLLIRFLNAA